MGLTSFPGGSESKASACKAADLGSMPGCGRSPGGGNGNPLQYFCLENPMDGETWWATVHGVAKSWTQLSDFTFFYSFSIFLVLQLFMLSSEDWKERTIIPGLERSPRRRHDNPLQYSCPENPIDRGALWATVHGVAKGRTRLSNFTFTSLSYSRKW